MVNVFPLISVTALGDFLFYVTAVNKMFNLGAGGDVLCYRVARNRGGWRVPAQTCAGKIVSMLGRTDGFGVKPLPFTLNEPDLAASHFFISIFRLILRKASQSSLSAALLESRMHLDFLSRLCLCGWT